MFEKQKLNHKLTNFCKNFGIKKVKIANEFAYFPDKDKITYTIYMDDTDEEYISLVNSKYNADIKYWYFIFALLHEVGHHITLNQLTKEDLETDLLLRKMIPLFENQGLAYINFTAERLATEWALEYITKNESEIWDFQWECWKLMRKIYKKG